MSPHFQPVSFSWVALHPQPRGVIQFIGGAFFGTFPTLFYRHLLQCLYGEGYTLVVLPFRFSLRHWQIACSLLEEQHRLRQILPELAHHRGYDASVYEKSSHYQWLGHSLGCKYIALLELLSGSAIAIQDTLPARLIEQQRRSPGIWNQGSLLLAPDISDLDSAIPIRPVVRWLNRLKIRVQPDRQQTLNLIRQSALFNLTAMVSFAQDTVAGSLGNDASSLSDVLWLSDYLQSKSGSVQELSGKHLEPVGWRVGDYIVDLNPWDKLIKPLGQWQVARTALALLKSLDRPADGLTYRDSPPLQVRKRVAAMGDRPPLAIGD